MRSTHSRGSRSAPSADEPAPTRQAAVADEPDELAQNFKPPPMQPRRKKRIKEVDPEEADAAGSKAQGCYVTSAHNKHA